MKYALSLWRYRVGSCNCFSSIFKKLARSMRVYGRNIDRANSALPDPTLDKQCLENFGAGYDYMRGATQK